MRKYEYLLLLSMSICNCNGCNTQTDKKEDKQDKIPGIRKLINDIDKYRKHPSPKSITLDSIINDLQKYILDNLLDIDKIINEITTLRDNKKYTFNEKQKSSLNNSINHLKRAKRNKKTYNNLLNKAINELNQVKNENRDDKKKEEIDNELDDIKNDIENIIDREELSKLKIKLERLKDNEKNDKGNINKLLNRINGKLNKIVKKEERKEKREEEKKTDKDKKEEKGSEHKEKEKKKEDKDPKKNNENKNKDDEKDKAIEEMQKILDNKYETTNDRLNKYILQNSNFSHETINIKGPGLTFKSWNLKDVLTLDVAGCGGLALYYIMGLGNTQLIYNDKKDEINNNAELKKYFDNNGKLIIIDDSGNIQDKLVDIKMWVKQWKNTDKDPDNKDYKKIPGFIPCKKDYTESPGKDGTFTILPKKNVLDDFIKQYWDEKFSNIKNFDDLRNFIVNQEENSIPQQFFVYDKNNDIQIVGYDGLDKNAEEKISTKEYNIYECMPLYNKIEELLDKENHKITDIEFTHIFRIVSSTINLFYKYDIFKNKFPKLYSQLQQLEKRGLFLGCQE